jgi:hypothetical protein
MLISMVPGCGQESKSQKARLLKTNNTIEQAATNAPYDANFTVQDSQSVSAFVVIQTNTLTSSAFLVFGDSNPPSHMIGSVVLALCKTPLGEQTWVAQRRLTYRIEDKVLRIEKIEMNTRLAKTTFTSNDIAAWTASWSNVLVSQRYAIPLEDIQRVDFILQKKDMVTDASLPPHTLNVHDLLVLLDGAGYSCMDPANTARLAIWVDEKQVSVFRIFCHTSKTSSSLTIDAAPNFSGAPFSSHFEIQADIKPENKEAILLIVNKINPALLQDVESLFTSNTPSLEFAKSLSGITLKTAKSEDSTFVKICITTSPGPFVPQQEIGTWSEQVRGKRQE